MINVVHICDKFGVRGSSTHGVSKYFAFAFPCFDTERFNVKLYALKNPEPASLALEAEGIQMEYLGKSGLSPSILTSFLRVIREERADILHLHGWIAANFGRLAGRLAGVPTIMHEHGVDPKFPASQRIADRLLVPCNHTVLTVSRSVRDFLIKHRSVKPEKIRIIYHGVPLSQFTTSDPRAVERVREELRIPEGAPVLGTVGRVDTQKGITHLVKAMGRIRKAFPDIRALVVGDGPKKQELETEAESLGLSGNMIFTGHRSDVRDVISLMDVQVFPSLWEGTPLTVFEAMATGRAIVSTNVDGLGEVLEDGKSALLVPPADPEALAEGVLRLLNDRRLAEKLRSGARERGKDFDISRTVRNLESLYEELYAGSWRGR